MTDRRPPPELLADAVEALRAGRLPDGEALQVALEVLEDVAGVGTELRRRRALRHFDELWASGEVWTRSAAEEAVARRLGVATSTVRWWRWLRELEKRPAIQQPTRQVETERRTTR